MERVAHQVWARRANRSERFGDLGKAGKVEGGREESVACHSGNRSGPPWSCNGLEGPDLFGRCEEAGIHV